MADSPAPKSPAHDSDRVLADARRSLELQRDGGRRLTAEARSIGRRSRALKNRHFLGRIWRMMLGVAGVIVAAMIAGLVVGGIGFSGLFFTALAALMVAAAVRVVDQLGIQLDALGLQLDQVGETLPAAAEIRQLVGGHLPELVASYTAIPAHLRGEARAGRTPDEQLTESLTRISTEIESVTRQLADGSIDDLAIKARYLDYKYGAALVEPANPPG